MIDSLAEYQSPSMIIDTATWESLNAFITKVLQGFSIPGSDVAKYFADPDVAIAGSGLDEYFMGAEAVQYGVTWVTTLNIRWEPRLVVSWMRGDIAWEQIRVDGHTIENEEPTIVQYVATGVFQRNRNVDGWTWLYWGGGEPQKVARL
ncbi:hypothetical protein ABH912_000519 [Pseudomonas sp. BT76 TE3572]|uniref:hypothetical protein n=1 Tax=Pseudomonas sp. BT76 TE3572 TaxID=3349325 RepID=UPI003D1F078F